jgi:hypothetical protein
MIVTIVTACVMQATDIMSGIALKNWDTRMRAADYLSLSDEMGVRAMLTDDGEFEYGKWRARKINSGFRSGLAFADVAIGIEFIGEKEETERLWNIAGRE